MTKQEKITLRRRIETLRQSEPGKDGKNRRICEKLISLPEFISAQTVMFYLGTPNEVGTMLCLEQAMKDGKKCVVPYCNDDALDLFVLHDFADLAPGTFGILEPKVELRLERNRQCSPDSLDLIIVPGVAFDRKGQRLGRGKGFYDRFLGKVRPQTHLVALAFECQLVAAVPCVPSDVPVDKIITEAGVYDCRPAA
jgi:5-formyltetrahydrofolate cyclo-ligase